MRKFAVSCAATRMGIAGKERNMEMDSEKTILVRVKKVSNLLDRFMMEVKTSIIRKVDHAKNISPIQGRIILYLHTATKKGDVFQKDIEARFDVRSSTATIILHRMEKNGLIIRETSSSDVRKKAVSLTLKAKEMLPYAKAEIENAERRVISGLTKRELEAFVRVLDKITENIS